MPRQGAPLTRSEQDYLKALYALGGAKTRVPMSSLVRRLALSAPSVTQMIARLDDGGLVRHKPRQGARLSAAGTRAALGILRRHRLIETYLVRVLHLDWSAAHEEAEVLEHGVSERVLKALDRQMRHPREDPHGHPIPDARGRLRRRRLEPLAALKRGARGRIGEMDDADGARLTRWRQIGLVPGAAVHVLELRPLDGVLKLEVAGRRHVMGVASLAGVWVKLLRGGRRGT